MSEIGLIYRASRAWFWSFFGWDYAEVTLYKYTERTEYNPSNTLRLSCWSPFGDARKTVIDRAVTMFDDGWVTPYLERKEKHKG